MYTLYMRGADAHTYIHSVLRLGLANTEFGAVRLLLWDLSHLPCTSSPHALLDLLAAEVRYLLLRRPGEEPDLDTSTRILIGKER